MLCRRHSSWKIVTAVVLITFLYASVPRNLDTAWCCGEDRSVLPGSAPHSNTSTLEKTDNSGPPLQSDSWVDQGRYLPIKVSYSLLAGTLPKERKFLTVGVSSVKRQKDSYLLATLRSIFSHSSPSERSSMVVVLLLADFDAWWRATMVGQIRAEFTPQLELGQLLVVHAPQKHYPPLTGLKRNFDDAPPRVTFRSKQNVDYSFLLHYSSGRSLYYLMLEDDVDCSLNFLSVIRKRVREQDAMGIAWTTLEFSSLGYIGKLYHSTHLPLLARFLFLFYQEMPCDFLLSHFRELLVSQKDPIILKPSLFQHMGTFSSFSGNLNKLKDQDFEPEPLSNPEGVVYSDIPPYEEHLPGLAYSSGGERFFWGREPAVGSHLTVLLTNPAVVRGVAVETGSRGRDLLASGVVELGRDPVGGGERWTCREFDPPLGAIGPDGRFERQDVDRAQGSASSCLRIRVTGQQKDWVIIKNIRIRVDKEPNTVDF